ncbi:MAG: hypothetical protein C5B60_09445 [Chloroflexi bacterium]|nr:MAG: hypothetical protein C5B60_09445 [Chloroflexota bacterium]
MFWSLDSMDEQTFGQLIALFRRRRGLNQADVAPLLASFGFRFPPQLSLLEGGTWPTRPERALIQELARLYTLSPREESFLMRQADILPSSTEQQSIIMRFGTTLLDFSSPACVVNMHWQLIAWNEAFAEFYDSSENLGLRTSQFKGSMLSVQAASQPSDLTLSRGRISSREESSLAKDPTEPSSSASALSQGVQGDDSLVLQENLSIFALLFGQTSRLRKIIEPDDWSKLAQFFLVRFWRTSLPMFNQHWYPSGVPPWIAKLEEDMQSRPIPENQEFSEMSGRIRRSLESEGGWADPHTQLLNNFLHDRLLFRQLGAQFQVIPTSMSDARFLFLPFQRTDSPGLVAEALYNRKYL